MMIMVISLIALVKAVKILKAFNCLVSVRQHMTSRWQAALGKRYLDELIISTALENNIFK